MKKQINTIIILLIILILTMIFTTLYESEYNRYDVNHDGQVDILDLLKVQKYIIESGDK